MRWDNLFDDLESQLEQELSADEVDLRAEEERLRLGRLTVRDRLLTLHEARSTSPDYAVRLELVGGISITVRPMTFGRDWISGDVVDESARSTQFILPLGSIAGLVLSRHQLADSIAESAETESTKGLSRRLGLAFVLRDLCRRRRDVEMITPGGSLHGTIDRVGRDHLDLAVHEAGAARRESAVVQYRVVPFDQVRLVRL